MDEAGTLLAVFPTEVWTLIIDQIKDIETLTSLWNTSAFFQPMLSPGELAFPLVAKILLDDIFRLNPYKPSSVRSFKTLLKSRLVCSKLQNVIDNGFETELKEAYFEVEKSTKEIPTFLSTILDMRYTFNDVCKLRAFQNHFEQTHRSSNRNPFLLRCAWFGSTEKIPTDIKTVWRLADEILERHGQHLWHVNLQYACTHQVKLIPFTNLKDLTLEFSHFSHFLELKATSVMWSVTKLSVDLSVLRLDEDGLDDVFHYITKRCTDRLEQLIIKFPNIYATKKLSNCSPEMATDKNKFARLWRLRLVVQDKLPLDFIVSLEKSLETLELELYWSARWNCSTLKRKQINTNLNVFEADGNMLETNLWKLFPKLQKVHYAHDSEGIDDKFTRKQWELHEKEKIVGPMYEKRFQELMQF